MCEIGLRDGWLAGFVEMGRDVSCVLADCAFIFGWNRA